MKQVFTDEIELYSLESFQILLDHEVNRSRRYKTPLTLVHFAIETDPDQPEIQSNAEMFVINILDVQLRDTDVSCRKGNEFLVLMPATDETGGRIVCQRLARLLNVPHETYDRVSFDMKIFVGMASIPGDELLTSNSLIQQASKAMEHARENQLTTAVIFSEIKP